MLEIGILKTWDSGTYKAAVQFMGSLTTYFDNISVSVSIDTAAMVVGNHVIVAIPNDNPKDACVVAAWPGGSTGIVKDHGGLTGLADDDHSQYLNNARHDLTARHTLGSVVPHDDHGALSGLADDDHSQYLNNARHDLTARHTLGSVVPHDVFTSLTDTPSSYSGEGGKTVKVKSDESGLELVAGGGGAADYPMKLKPAITRYVLPGWAYNSITNVTATAGRIYYIPIFVQETTTYIRIGISVSTAVAGTADLRIYNWSSGLPGSQVLSAGTVSHNASGTQELTISQQLTRGYYFLAIRCSGAPRLHVPNAAYVLTCPVSGIGDNIREIDWVILTKTAAMADPAPTPDGAVNGMNAFVRMREN